MLPPTRVQIKRKATDDPVEILRVHDELATGRNASQFVFKRQRVIHGLRLNGAKAPGLDNFTDDSQRAPRVKVSQPGDELRDPFNQSLGGASPATAQGGRHNAVIQNVGTPAVSVTHAGAADTTIPSRPIAEPRRFHLSRKAADQGSGGGTNTRRTTGKSSIAVFHERKAAALASHAPAAEHPHKPSASHLAAPAELVKKTSISVLRLTPVSAVKPRRNAPPQQQRAAALAAAEAMPWNATGDVFEAAMQAYVLNEIGRDLPDEKTPEPAPPTPESRAPAPASRGSPRFKPRAAAGLRYHERHPGAVPAAPVADDAPVDAMDVDDDDASYIIETYIRMRAESADLAPDEASVGLLVLDSQPDIDAFYDDDSDSDSDLYDEEEDENAENHPSTDYPDEEVASDDEYGANPYQYRNRNASDNEEYGADDARFSDDEREERKQPWERRPWKEAYSGKTADASDDEEGGAYY